MPNTPALVGAGASAIAGGHHASEADLDWAEGLLAAVGIVVRVPEAARRLGLDGVEVYRLISAGELAAGRGPDGLVYVRTAAIAAYVGGV